MVRVLALDVPGASGYPARAMSRQSHVLVIRIRVFALVEVHEAFAPISGGLSVLR